MWCVPSFPLQLNFCIRFISPLKRLEQRKLQLKFTMEDRMEEIRVHKDVLNAQSKAIEEQRTALNKGEKE